MRPDKLESDTFIGLNSYLSLLIGSKAHPSSRHFLYDQNITLKVACYYYMIEFSFTS